MKRGVTLPITLTIEGVDLTGADWLIVTLKPQYLAKIELGADRLSVASDGTDTTIVFALTEAESVALDTGLCEVDVNWSLDGQRNGVIPTNVNISKTLLTRVVDEA